MSVAKKFQVAISAVALLMGTVSYSAMPAGAAPGDISGTVFDDVNADGANGSGEVGVGGVIVTAYGPTGPLGSTTTAADGSWTIGGLFDGTQHRIEFTGLPAGYESGPVGADSESSVTFATPETTGVDYGIHVPTICNPTPPSGALLATFDAISTCTAVVDPSGTLPQDSFGMLDVDNSIPGDRSDTTADTPMFHHPDYDINRLGNVFGTAIDNRTGNFFAAASSNYSHVFYNDTVAGGRYTGIVRYGDIGGGAEDLSAAGTLYRMDAITGAPTVFAVLPQQSTTVTHRGCEGATGEAVDRTTGVGLGNVVYDETNDQLFVSNWEDGHIYRLSMAGAILDAYDFDVDDDGTAGMANGKTPYGLEVNNDGTRLFWGTIFGREIWSVDLTAAGGFTGGAAVNGAGVSIHSNSGSEQLNQTVTLTPGEPAPGFLNTDLYRSISDLEILPDGQMLVGLRAGCYSSPHASYNHTGQTHLASVNGAGLYTNDLGAFDISVTGDAGLDDTYGGVAYRENDDGSVDYAATAADILAETGPHGLAMFPGGAPGAQEDPLGAINYGVPNDPKGVIGDVQILNTVSCTPSAIQIGDRVWLDLDQDGVQDPDEPALAGVGVSLIAGDGTTVLATTTTDANGLYNFGSADGVAINSSYFVEFDTSSNTTPLPGGAANSELTETVADAATGANADAIDSDVVADRIAITTGSEGVNDHTYDAGYSLTYDLALTKVYTSDTFGNTTDGIVENGSDATFTISVTNQGAAEATSIEVTDYIPAGMTLNDPTWTDNGNSTATIAAGPVAAGATIQIPITLSVDTAAAGTTINIAEISVDDGIDQDSTPNVDSADDNQPTNPRDATDDVIDNTDGDEDDHDIAGLTVTAYDLALTKVYTSDTSLDGNTADGVIEPGDNVTFTITVTNQGSVGSGAFEVTDFLPTGFSLNDPAWNDNGNSTATFFGGGIASGGSTDITITLRADNPAAGDAVNWAEISSDSGNDPDSTPNADVSDDIQPVGPGAPTDGVIDNTDGDEDDHDPAGVTVNAYDLALTQVYTSDTFGDTTDGVIEAGADVTFTITVTNQGTLDATTFDVVDYIPAGFTLNDPAWNDNGNGTATFNGGPLLAGGTSDITITLTATSPAAGDFVNWAEISVDDGADVDSTPNTDISDDNQPVGPGAPTDNVNDNTDGDEDDHDPAGVTVGSYDLALTKVYTSDSSVDGNSTDGIVFSGDDVTFTITVTNQGTVDSGAFEVTDYLPAGFTLNDFAWTDNGNDTATITAGPIAAGASADLTIVLTATSPGSGTSVNGAEISSDSGTDGDSTPNVDPDDDNQPVNPGDPTDDVIDNTGGDEDDHDIAGVTVNAYDLALTQVYTSDTFANTTDGVIEQGSDVTFTITVTNQGTADATSFEVTDYLPAGFTLNDPAWNDNGNGTATIAGGPLLAGDSTDITITLTATSVAPGDFVNWAEISTDDGDDIDSTPNADVSDDNQPVGPGAPTDNVNDNTDGDEDDHDPAGVTVAFYDLALTKVYTSDNYGNTSDGNVANGADVTFTITVTNQGTTGATAIEVTDYIPAGFTLNDPAWTDNGNGTATIAAGPIVAGGSQDVTIVLRAATAAAGVSKNIAEISVDDGADTDSAPNVDPDDDNQPTNPGDATDDVTDNTAGDEDDHDIAGVNVVFYDLALTKIYTSDSVGAPNDGVTEPGADVTFTITVTNQGTADATAFEVTDYIPAGFALNDPTWNDNGNGTATIAAGPLAAGASTDLTITLTAGSAAGDFVNWAEISTDDGDDIDSTPNTDVSDDNQPVGPGAPTDGVTDNTDGDEDDHDPAGITVEIYDLALTKAYSSDTSIDGNNNDGVIQPGDDVTFTITVTNQGTVDSGAFEITDYLPTGFSLNDPAWTDNGNDTATISAGPLGVGASVNVTVTLTAVSPSAGDLVNWAEISSDSGNDVDSTPNTDVSDDSQPVGPGAPTDDVIDNTDGDEDDHDPAGFTVNSYDLALTQVYTSDNFGDTTDGVIETGSDATFTITVTNQGTIDATTFDVIDYIPAGFTLNDPAWNDNGDGTATFTGGPLAVGNSDDITITLTATTATAGDIVNWAEISADDGADVDSTPNTDVLDDNQPAGPGAPTDNVNDNTDGDEDDHDPAGVTIGSYDLALTKVYTSDNSADANATDGLILVGDDVTFTISVTNQGTVDSGAYEATDYIPAGFTLNDPAWNDNGNGTATIAAGPIAPGASADLTIVLTATAPATGDSVNRAEVSSDSGTDVDSTPNVDPGDDNQPTNPGDPTDDVTDNTDGDEDDHDIAGVTVLFYDLALSQVYTSDTFGDPTDGSIEEGTDVTFTITVTNQGTTDATSFEITDYLPAGFTLNDPAWNDNGNGTATIVGGPLLAGDSTDITITMTATSVAAGDFVNWAEISTDDGDDIDSNPNTDVSDDNQPAGPGAPTDNVIDNTDGDEDDHDPAGVTVDTYDLALVKVYTSDTSVDGNATDGLIQLGDEVTFTMTVINQGTLDAAAFTVTDYIPAGFTLNDPAWTDNGNGTASINSGPLASGLSVDIPVTFTAGAGASGTIRNAAEISADDGNDLDSSPDPDPDDDNQPVDPGDPTDDATDNTDGDEDDHDLARLIIQAARIPASSLPVTGVASRSLAGIGLFLTILGFGFAAIARDRDRKDSEIAQA